MSKDRNHGDKVKQVFKVNTVSFQAFNSLLSKSSYGKLSDVILYLLTPQNFFSRLSYWRVRGQPQNSTGAHFSRQVATWTFQIL